MAKDSGPINQHKRLAMGQKVTGMKKGGAVKEAKGASKAKVKKGKY